MTTTLPPELDEAIGRVVDKITSQMSREFGAKLLAFCLKEMTRMTEQGLSGKVVAQMAGFELVDCALAMFDGLEVPHADVTTCIDVLRQRFEIDKLHRKGTLTDAERKEMLDAMIAPVLNARRRQP